MDVRGDEEPRRVGAEHELAHDEPPPKEQSCEQECETRLNVTADQRWHTPMIAEQRTARFRIASPSRPQLWQSRSANPPTRSGTSPRCHVSSARPPLRSTASSALSRFRSACSCCHRALTSRTMAHGSEHLSVTIRRQDDGELDG